MITVSHPALDPNGLSMRTSRRLREQYKVQRREDRRKMLDAQDAAHVSHEREAALALGSLLARKSCIARPTRRDLLKFGIPSALAIAAARQLKAQSFAPLPPWQMFLQTQKTGTFTASITKSGATLLWSFGDGTLTAANNASHTYSGSVLRNVSVSSSDGWGGVTLIRFNGGCVGAFPAIGPNCHNLTSIRADGNTFGGPLASFVNAPNLATFELSTIGAAGGNSFAGYNLPDFSKNTKLTLFGIDTCTFSGGQPNLGACTLLTQLDYQSNNFTGPFSVANLPTSLVIFYGAENALTGAQFPDFSTFTNLQGMDVSGQANHGGGFGGGACSSFAALGATITFLQIDFDNIGGTIPSFAANTGLDTFWLSGNPFTGTLPTMAALSNLTDFECFSTGINNVVAGSFATQSFMAQCLLGGNALPSAAVNQVLADCITTLGLGNTTCHLDLSGGTNGAPTGAGITNKATLIAAGWTVMTN